jgi:hypothetical protein
MLHRRRDNVGPELLNSFLFVGGQAHRRQGHSPFVRIRFTPMWAKRRLSQDRLYPVFVKRRHLGLAGEYTPC